MARRSDVVARRQLFTRDGHGRPTPIEIEFLRPSEQPTGEWGCICSLRGLRDARLNRKPQPIYGVDAVQALSLAMRFIDTMLMSSKDFAEGHLSWEPGGKGLQLTDFRGELGVKEGKGIRAVNIVRTVELRIDRSLPYLLRVEVLENEMGPHTYYSTRVWRADPILVEDPMFDKLEVAEKTPDAAIEATITRIKWQLFKDQRPRASRRPKRRS